MKLPPFSVGKKQKELFLSLLLYPDAVDAAVWEIGFKKETIIHGAVTQELVSDTWEERNTAADKCVSTLEEITKSQNINKVILGLPAEYLTDEGDVKHEVKHHIKELTKLLQLSPIGFVSIYQAIIHDYKLKEGVPPSLILMGVTSVGITVTLYKVGNFIGQRILPKEGNLIGHLEDALASFTDVEILPSRIIIYGTNKIVLDEAKREILEYHWQQKANFLHFPKAEVLPLDGAAIAVSHAGAQELAKTLEMSQSDEMTEPGFVEGSSHPNEESQSDEITGDTDSHYDDVQDADVQVDEQIEAKDEREDESEDKTEIDDEKVEQQDAEFDEENLTDQIDESYEDVHANVTQVDPEEFGFVNVDESEDEQEKRETEPLNKRKQGIPIKQILHAGIFRFTHLFSRKNRQAHDVIRNPLTMKKRILILLFILLPAGVLGVGYILFTNVLPTAVVAVSVAPQDMKSQQKLLVEIDATSSNVVSAKKLEQTVDGEKTIPVSGKKTIGDAAKGTITIFNKSLVSRTFKKGTIVTTNSIEFTLDDDVVIASASESLAAGSITYGKSNVKVTAKEIGSKGNIGAGKDFSVSGVSSSIATGRNEEVFTGGSSKDITVVSRNDQDTLIKTLTEELVNQAKNGFRANEGEQLISETIKTSVKEKSFSHEIGEEAKELTGKATIMISGTVFTEEAIKSSMADALQAQVPQGYRLAEDSVTVSVNTPVIAKNGDISIEATVTARAIPSVDITTLPQQVAGKTVEEATELIRNINGVSNVSITVASSLSKTRLPKRAEKIRVSVESQ